jgi:hypothetical protein
MEAVFAGALAEAARDGEWSALRCAVRELAHLPGLAAQAHWQAWDEQPARTGSMERQMGMSRSSKIIVYGLLPFLLAMLGWWISSLLGGAAIGVLATAGAVAGALFVPALAWTVQRLNPWVWIAAGLTLLGTFAIPGIASYNTGEFLARNIASPLPGFGWWIPPVSVVAATMLLQNGLRLWGRPADGSAASRGLALLCAVLGVLLMARTVHYLYWLLVWDLTMDPLNWFWIVLPMLAALASGAVLIATLPGRPWAATVCAVLSPVLLAATYSLSQRVDFRQLTEQRAARAAQAVEAYYAREGRYPATLRQAQPWYALPLAGPVIIYGQDWCYRAGADSYQLGYVDRDHWSSPYLIGHVASAAGDTTGSLAICDAEIAAIVEQYPLYSQQDP